MNQRSTLLFSFVLATIVASTTVAEAGLCRHRCAKRGARRIRVVTYEVTCYKDGKQCTKTGSTCAEAERKARECLGGGPMLCTACIEVINEYRKRRCGNCYVKVREIRRTRCCAPCQAAPESATQAPKPEAKAPQPAVKAPKPAPPAPKPAAKAPKATPTAPKPAAKTPAPAPAAAKPAVKAPAPAPTAPKPAAKAPAAAASKPAAKKPAPAVGAPKPAPKGK